MAHILLVLLFSLLCIACFASTDCKRHRKPWYQLTQQERNVFVDGFQRIRKNGRLYNITAAHADDFVIPMIHYSSLLLFWHEYLVFEVESAIRDLGGKFECFGMPYWDWTQDAGLEDDPPILNTGIGSNGDPNNNFCVMNDNTGTNWKLCTNPHDIQEQCFWSPFDTHCSNTESMPHCCLKRVKSETMLVTTAANMGYFIQSKPKFKHMSADMVYPHNQCHYLIAQKPQAHMMDGYASEDPAFFLLHSFLGYLRSLWTDCWDYDHIDVTDLKDGTNAFSSYFMMSGMPGIPQPNLGLDDKFIFYGLENDPNRFYKEDITVRKMWDVSNMNIVYELGPFYKKHSGLDKWCANKLDSEWFVDTMNSDEQFVELSPVYKYSEGLWKNLQIAGMKQDDIFKAVASASCKYTRRISKNSCWDKSRIEAKEKGICDENIIDGEVIFDDILQERGVKEYDCLMRIRNDMFGASLYLTNYIKNIICRKDTGNDECPKYEGKYKYVINQYDANISTDLSIDLIWSYRHDISVQIWIVFVLVCIGFIIACKSRDILKGTNSDYIHV